MKYKGKIFLWISSALPPEPEPIVSNESYTTKSLVSHPIIDLE
jgi:hypothetical protein